MRRTVIVATMLMISTASYSQTPYAGMQERDIKALSDQQVADLKAGRGMGLALAAELNGYPGPSHLLELSDRLGLTSDQHSALKEMLDAMKAETIPIGEFMIVQEERLDRLFAGKTVSEQQLHDATRDIGETQGRLRNAHLSYHLQARAILKPDQIRRYAVLRGYGPERQEPTRHKHHHD